MHTAGSSRVTDKANAPAITAKTVTIDGDAAHGSLMSTAIAIVGPATPGFAAAVGQFPRAAYEEMHYSDSINTARGILNGLVLSVGLWVVAGFIAVPLLFHYSR